MSEEKKDCCCSRAPKLIFSCSGAADVGAIADQAARQLTRDKTAFMCCTAAVAAGVPEIMEKARAATQILVIDGCDHDCSRTVVEQGGFTGFAHVRLKDLGMQKGKTPVTDENIATAARACAEALARHVADVGTGCASE